MSKYIFKKGDLIGINERDHIYGFVIAQVIRHNRFFYCMSLETHTFHFVVFDPAVYFLLCPDFDPEIQPDIDVIALGAQFYGVLDRLFGFTDENDGDSQDDD